MNIAVVDGGGTGICERDAGAVSNLLRENLWRSDRFNLLEPSQMDKIIGKQGPQLSGCTETYCAAQVGRALSVEETIVGSLEMLRDMYVVSIRFVNVELVSVNVTESVQCLCSAEYLHEAIEELVERTGDSFE